MTDNEQAERDLQEEFESPTTYEGMIGRAILGDDTEKTRQMIRVDCKLYASQKMFCDCGTIFDQKKIQILRDQDETVKAVCCMACRQKAQEKLSSVSDTTGLSGWTWANWTHVEPVCPVIPGETFKPKK